MRNGLISSSLEPLQPDRLAAALSESFNGNELEFLSNLADNEHITVGNLPDGRGSFSVAGSALAHLSRNRCIRVGLIPNTSTFLFQGLIPNESEVPFLEYLICRVGSDSMPGYLDCPIGDFSIRMELEQLDFINNRILRLVNYYYYAPDGEFYQPLMLIC